MLLLPRSPNPRVGWLVTVLIVAVSMPMKNVSAIMQTGAVDVRLRDGSSYTLLSSQASFGMYPAEGAANNEAHRLVMAPSLLCDNGTDTTSDTTMKGATVLVARGVCSFETKAWNAQQLGAAGMIVYGSLASRYSLNETKAVHKTDYKYTEDDILYPKEYYDYDCSKGQAKIPASKMQFTPLPYNAEHNDPLLSDLDDPQTNLCRQHSETGFEQCASGACLLTGAKDDNDNFNACCAWDLHVWLYNDPASFPSTSPQVVTIPAAYLTMGQAHILIKAFNKDPQLFVTLYSRPRPNYNLSSILIWLLGVFVAALAAFLSADDYHRMIRKVLRKNKRAAEKRNHGTNDHQQRSPTHNHTSKDEQQQQQRERDEDSLASHSHNSHHPPSQAEESLELTVGHAFGFIVMASTGLLVLFFFKIYRVVKVFYAVGCSKAVSQIVFFPTLWRMAHRMNYRDRIVWRTGTEDFGDITVLDILSHVCGFTLGIVWLIICFTVRHPENITFYWVMQDVFGAAMCISFLAVIKLNSLKVAASLLVAAFFYDVSI